MKYLNLVVPPQKSFSLRVVDLTSRNIACLITFELIPQSNVSVSMSHKIFETDSYINHVHSLPHIQFFFQGCKLYLASLLGRKGVTARGSVSLMGHLKRQTPLQ